MVHPGNHQSIPKRLPNGIYSKSLAGSGDLFCCLCGDNGALTAGRHADDLTWRCAIWARLGATDCLLRQHHGGHAGLSTFTVSFPWPYRKALSAPVCLGESRRGARWRSLSIYPAFSAGISVLYDQPGHGSNAHKNRHFLRGKPARDAARHRHLCECGWAVGRAREPGGYSFTDAYRLVFTAGHLPLDSSTHCTAGSEAQSL